jgi:hypothetical protein
MLGEIYIDDTEEMAKVVAQLVREGVTFKVSECNGAYKWVIELTGGC